MPADAELSSLLGRRQAIAEGRPAAPAPPRCSVYAEFHEMSRQQIREYEATFRRYDEGKDGFLCLDELKRMMEKLGAPQTHLGLKAMIKEVDEDSDDKISFREFLLIYRKARAGELTEESGLSQLAALTEINVEEVGVGGAKTFFEAKIEEQKKTSKFEDEIRQQQEQRRREEEEKAQRKAEFKQRAAVFQARSVQES